MNELLTRLEQDLADKARSTRYNYLRWASLYLGAHPDPATWDKQSVESFLDQLKTNGLAAGTQEFAGCAVRRLFEVAGLDKPRLRKRMTTADVYAQKRVSLSREECETAIRASLRSPWPEQATMTALVSVYGMRSGEVAAMRPEYVDLKAGVLAIPTAKGGEPRLHGIPACLRPVLHPEHFPGHRSETEMWSWWRDLEKRAGIPRREHQGWHSLRRGLNRLLAEAGVLDIDRRTWMGWSVRQMVDLYAMLPDRRLDEVIFARHPLLPVWAQLLGG